MRSSLVPLRLVLLAFTIFPAAFAVNVEDALQKRQSSAPAGTGSSASQTPSTTSSSPTSSSAGAASSLSQSSSVSSSSTPIPSITPTPVASPSATPSSSSIPTTATPAIVIQTLTSSATKQIVTTLMSIDSGGSTIQQVFTTSGLVVGTSVTTSTSFPGVNGSSEPSGSPGLSSKQKKIIIGVVVGVGGFVILGGMALVAWRVWGRKKQPSEDDDRVHAATPDARTGPGGSPFKSTLDQYHNPGTVNTASNF
ncbi:MAG: hypothetical protein M1840_002274 [Geoglossum simile]|nr:MAG: hypothetical protein M1840_002274 [Geoglossum simile]